MSSGPWLEKVSLAGISSGLFLSCGALVAPRWPGRLWTRAESVTVWVLCGAARECHGGSTLATSGSVVCLLGYHGQA